MVSLLESIKKTKNKNKNKTKQNKTKPSPALIKAHTLGPGSTYTDL